MCGVHVIIPVGTFNISLYYVYDDDYIYDDALRQLIDVLQYQITFQRSVKTLISLRIRLTAYEIRYLFALNVIQ